MKLSGVAVSIFKRMIEIIHLFGPRVLDFLARGSAGRRLSLSERQPRGGAAVGSEREPLAMPRQLVYIAQADLLESIISFKFPKGAS